MTRQFTGVQILRFVAAMLVVVMHITQAISIHITGQGSSTYWHTGSAGVDIFFVISGFVMAMSTRDAPASGAARARTAWVFMQRRLLRIVPLYWFYTFLKVSLLLLAPTLAVTSSIDAGHLAASLLFIPSISPWGLVQPVLPVGWTLNFEMLFYAVFAIAIALGAPRARFCIAIFLAILLAASYFPDSTSLAFYANWMVFEFILGVLIAQLVLTGRSPPPAVAWLLLLVGAVVILGIDWGVKANPLLTWGVGAAALVLAAAWLEPLIARLPLAPRIGFLGDASYSIYLSHAFVVPAGVLLCRRLGLQDATLITLGVATAVVAAGCVSYLWLEKPMTAYLKRVLFPARPPGYPATGGTHAN